MKHSSHVSTGFSGYAVRVLVVLVSLAIMSCAKPTPRRLYEATARDDIAAMRSLLAKGADPNIIYWGPAMSGIGGNAPLHVAVIRNNPESIDLLLQHGARIDLEDDVEGLTPLMKAASGGRSRIDAMRRLLASGADPVGKNKQGESPLSAALRSRSPDAVRTLAEAGVDMNMPIADMRRRGRSSTWRPLIVVCCIPYQTQLDQSDIDMVRVLLELGADPFAMHDDTISVVEYIEENCPQAQVVIGILKERGR
jgi:ankyrin repeat protein